MRKPKRYRSWAAACALVALGVAPGGAVAGDPSTRDWIPAPPGTNVIALYGLGLKSHGLYDRGERIAGAEVGVTGLVYRQMHYREFFGKTVQLEFIVPVFRTHLDLPGTPRDQLTGVGDVTLGSAIWLYNNEETRTWLAWEPFITLPVGRYRSDRPDTSPGKNRWSTVQDLAFVKGVGESSFVEAVAELEIYGRNSNWMGQTLKKKPSWRFMALASTDLGASTYAGVRYRYETGGKETVAGSTLVPSVDKHQLALELTHQINPSHQVQLQYVHDVRVDNGPRLRGVQLRYAYIF